MPELSTWFAFAAASALVIVVPGPSVTVIVANSLRHGTRAGMLNIAGTQFGLATMLIVLALGLEALMAGASALFEVVRLVGAAYLVWLGIGLLRSDGRLGSAEQAPARSSRALFWQGFLVIWANPKALFFFGALIPQFVVPGPDAALQAMVLGATFMALATVLDGGYALAAGKAGALLTRTRVRLVERVSGLCLIGGGLWLALSRRA
ncbi:MAG: LysE family translocator [Pseudomonadota bacterium]